MAADGSGVDWAHAATGLGGGAVGTFLTWVWRVARIEPKIALKIKEAEERLEAKIDDSAAGVKADADEKIRDMTGHFQETLSGMRRQMDDIGKGSLPRGEFETFRKEAREDAEIARRENREDFAKLEAKIDQILARHK